MELETFLLDCYIHEGSFDCWLSMIVLEVYKSLSCSCAELAVKVMEKAASPLWLRLCSRACPTNEYVKQMVRPNRYDCAKCHIKAQRGRNIAVWAPFPFDKTFISRSILFQRPCTFSLFTSLLSWFGWLVDLYSFCNYMSIWWFAASCFSIFEVGNCWEMFVCKKVNSYFELIVLKPSVSLSLYYINILVCLYEWDVTGVLCSCHTLCFLNISYTF